MLLPAQQALLFQLNNYFAQLELLFSPQQLENIHISWFTLNPFRDVFEHEQYMRSLEREKRFRGAQHHNGI